VIDDGGERLPCGAVEEVGTGGEAPDGRVRSGSRDDTFQGNRRRIMNRASWFLVLGLLVATTGARAQDSRSTAAPEWSMNATIIEACSCPMFCQCYFNTKPASHGGPGCHAGEGGEAAFCKFNNAFRVNQGRYGSVDLAGAKFWVLGDLGGDFTQGMQWAQLHFDPSVTKEQREGIRSVLGHLYPVKWGSFTEGKDAPIEWKATKDRAEARLDGGKIAEVVLKRNQGMTDDPIVIKNLKYWGAPRNEGFVLMANEVEAYRGAEKAFEFKGTNGFMITFDIDSRDVQQH
jgi:hypothetical protein